MEKKFLPQLCGVELQNNKIESGQPLIVTTRWKNVGEKAADFKGKIAMDVEYMHYQRLEENQDTIHTVKWVPYPAMYQWKTDEIVATTGIWRNRGGAWGGSYRVVISILDDNGTRLSFIDKNGNLVDHDNVTVVDVGWGLGRKRLWENDWHENNVYVEQFAQREAKKYDVAELDGFFRFDKKTGVPVGYGEWNFDAEAVEICARKVDTDTHYSLHTEEEIKVELLKATCDEIRYKLSVFCGSFELIYSGNKQMLNVKIENAKMDKGYELISLYIPSLVASGEAAQMVDLWFGGRLVDVKKTVPMGIRHLFDADQLGSLYDDKQHIVVDTTDLNTVLHQSINEVNGKKSGVIGIELFIMKPAHKAGLESIMLPKASDCRIQSVETGWNEAVKVLRDKYHGNGCHVYDRAIIYKFMGDWGPKIPEDAAKLSKPMTLKQMKQLVIDINKIFDGVPQVGYVGGWQLEGHDTGYPNVDKHPINPKMECTEEEFAEFLASGEKYNAALSLHDNFEDIYLEPDAVHMQTGGIDCYGEPYKCWIWCGGQAYPQIPKKFVECGRARERITNIVKRFGIKHTYHLDGLTSEILRENFEPGNQSDFNENNEYKKEIVKIWNEFGVDISSESLTSPLVGTIGHAWSTRDRHKATYFPGEQHIPVVAMACHGIAPYNMISLYGSMDRSRIMWGIAYGGNVGWGDIDKIDVSLINGYYIQGLPMGLIEYEKMVSCDITEDYHNVEYTNNCHVYCDKKNVNYEIVKNGTVIAKDFTTFAPGFKPDTYLAYADHDCTVVYDAPEGWTDATAVEFINGDKAIPVEIKDGKITLTLTAHQPQRVVKK